MPGITPNPKKRGYSLPPGCKDLIDVLQPQTKKRSTQSFLTYDQIAAWQSGPPIAVHVNDQIVAREVEVIDATAGGKHLGVLALAEALALARSRGIDLIEIEPGRTPPLCMFMHCRHEC